MKKQIVRILFLAFTFVAACSFMLGCQQNDDIFGGKYISLENSERLYTVDFLADNTLNNIERWKSGKITIDFSFKSFFTNDGKVEINSINLYSTIYFAINDMDNSVQINSTAKYTYDDTTRILQQYFIDGIKYTKHTIGNDFYQYKEDAFLWNGLESFVNEILMYLSFSEVFSVFNIDYGNLDSISVLSTATEGRRNIKIVSSDSTYEAVCVVGKDNNPIAIQAAIKNAVKSFSENLLTINGRLQLEQLSNSITFPDNLKSYGYIINDFEI